MRGFSLVEVLIVLAIVLILATVTLPLFGSLVAATDAAASGELVAQALRLARERARAGLGGEVHGVKFLTAADPIEYVIFRGSDYASRDPQYDLTQSLPASATLNFIVGGDEIVFGRGQSGPDGPLVLGLALGGTGRQVEVSNIGLIQIK